jgi:curved DNA-binding protein CbpA
VLYLSLLGLLEHQAPPNLARADAAAALELPRGASPTQARRAFRRLALRLHPDRHPTAPPEERARLAERFARVAAAYRQLSRHAS